MKIGGPSGQAAQNRALDLAHVVKPSIDERLAEIGGGLHFSRDLAANGDSWQISYVESAHVHRRISRAGIASAYIQVTTSRGLGPPQDSCGICGKVVPLFTYYDWSCSDQGGTGFCCDECALDLIGDVFGVTHEATLRADAENPPEDES